VPRRPVRPGPPWNHLVSLRVSRKRSIKTCFDRNYISTTSNCFTQTLHLGCSLKTAQHNQLAPYTSPLYHNFTHNSMQTKQLSAFNSAFIIFKHRSSTSKQLSAFYSTDIILKHTSLYLKTVIRILFC
jgi:hypothetical protein